MDYAIEYQSAIMRHFDDSIWHQARQKDIALQGSDRVQYPLLWGIMLEHYHSEYALFQEPTYPGTAEEAGIKGDTRERLCETQGTADICGKYFTRILTLRNIISSY